MRSVILFACGLWCLSVVVATAADNKATKKPNIIIVLADDLGYGDIGCYGQKHIKTPRLDRMAAEGIRFTDFYAGATVCAPSRSVLMTGQHHGRTWVRGNSAGPAQTLRDEDITIAKQMKKAGYATALCGKWGLGELNTSGHPNKQGFDHFFGYLNQRHAHNYYPTFLIRNSEVVPLRNVPADNPKANGKDGSGWAKERIDYTHELVMNDAFDWVKAHHQEPFFLYLSLTIPHANNEAKHGTGNGQEIPDYGDYAKENWPDPDKGQAAMISLMDRDVGRLLDLLEELQIDKNTMVLFTSDNGPHREGNNNPEFFDANGPLRGLKRDLYDGGIRVPTIVRWPGVSPTGVTSDYVGSFVDFMATCCDLAGVATPDNTDGISMVPTIRGDADQQKKHEYLYWEFYEQGSRQAVRFGTYKAIRQPMFTGKIELYDLATDLGEQNNIAAQHPDLVKKAEGYMQEAHIPNPNWKVPKKR